MMSVGQILVLRLYLNVLSLITICWQFILRISVFGIFPVVGIEDIKTLNELPFAENCCLKCLCLVLCVHICTWMSVCDRVRVHVHLHILLWLCGGCHGYTSGGIRHESTYTFCLKHFCFSFFSSSISCALSDKRKRGNEKERKPITSWGLLKAIILMVIMMMCFPGSCLNFYMYYMIQL